MLVYIIKLLFTTYTFLLLIRVFGSWFPSFAGSKLMRFVAFYTDPYLNLFRRFIPPLGMLDLSPMIAFFALQFFQYIILYLFK